MKMLKTSFDQLDRKIVDMLNRRGMFEPTDPQSKIIPLVLENRDVLLLSPTGSGKTEAAILPIFHKILRENPEPISTLFITPLRALNRDMLARLVSYGDELGIRIQVRHSDITDADKRRIVTHPAQVLITTPESLQILLSGKRLREIISHVKYVIVDELHETAQNERGSQFSIALERLSAITNGFQRIGLSATVGNVNELATFLSPHTDVETVRADLTKKIDITVGIPAKAPESVAEIMGCDEQYAGAILHMWSLIEQHTGTLVFVNTRSVAEDIAFRLKMYLGDPPIQVHHGSLSKDARETAEKDFKSNKIKALICTSSLELGIDIGSADLVIQFNSPRQINKLIQRVGRSGHWIEKTSKGHVVCSDIIELEEAMAIVGHAKDGHLENVMIRKSSLATLANQIVSELKFRGRIDRNELYEIVSKAYPFLDLSFDEYLEVVDFLVRIRKIWQDSPMIGKKGGVLRYFLENISMIPSEKNYRVIDIVNKKFIGTLDERYVINEIEPGSYFVMKGSTWRTQRLDKEKIFVEPFATAAIAPKWSGEDIPVLLDVTGRVSHNRENKKIENFIDEHSKSVLSDWYEKESATMNRAIVESYGGEIIVQLLLGTRANFALAEILSSLIASITGESVESDYSPYHVYLRSSRKIVSADVKKIILSIEPERLESYVMGSARRSRFFNSVFLYEAKKFGIISNDAEIGRMRFDKIVDAYHDSPVYKDSIRKLIFDYMDVETLRSYLLKMRNNEIEFVLKDGLSESSKVFLSHYSERVLPLKPTKTILESVRKRLMNEQITLLCTSCKNVRTIRIKEITSVKCSVCGSSLVASLSPFEKELLDSVKRESPEYRKVERRLIQNAHLVRERGLEAVIVMAARGIGPGTASRLLEVTYRNDDDFVRAILTSEMEFARNRRFWD